MIHELLASFTTIMMAELGDKTQLLSLLLVIRFKKIQPILWGICVAIFLSQFLAGIIGVFLYQILNANILSILVGISFIAGSVLCLLPEKKEQPLISSHYGIFVTSLVAFLLAEMADKTQLMAIALSAQFDSLIVIPMGAALGMLAINIPTLFFGELIVKWIPIKYIRYTSAIIFFIVGMIIIIGRYIHG